jgi:hypothetical protein
LTFLSRTPLADPIAAAYALDAPAIKAGDPMSINDLVAAIRELVRRKMLKDGIFPSSTSWYCRCSCRRTASAALGGRPGGKDQDHGRHDPHHERTHGRTTRHRGRYGAEQMALEDKVYLLEAQQMVLNTVLQKFGYCPMFE